jgi:hypothetical protein
MKALQAGKHVLLEKPSCDRVDETRQLFEFAESKGLLLLEAFHNRSVLFSVSECQSLNVDSSSQLPPCYATCKGDLGER